MNRISRVTASLQRRRTAAGFADRFPVRAVSEHDSAFPPIWRPRGARSWPGPATACCAATPPAPAAAPDPRPPGAPPAPGGVPVA